MTKIIYVEPDGMRHEIDVANENSVMRGAVSNGIPGIVAECGGAAACATCRVQVDEQWINRLPPPRTLETSLLEDYEDNPVNIRLSCQINVNDELDGLIVHIPASQY